MKKNNLGFFLLDIIKMNRYFYESRIRLDKLRFELLQSQIQYCYDNVPFYQKIFREKKLYPNDFKQVSDLQHYPIITKEEIIKDYTQFFSKKYRMDKCYKSHTSGSTGQPFWTCFDTRSWKRKKYISKLRARFTCGMAFREKVAIFECESIEKIQKENKKITIQKPFFNIKKFSIFENMKKTVSDLIKFNPQNFYGSPSYIFQLGQFMDKNSIILNRLKRIFTSSELLEKNVRCFLNSFFKAEIFDIYGSTEFKEIAWECRKHKGYHINEDEIICEILKDGCPAEIGEIGDIVITDLHNKAMPLIRYQLQDKGYFLGEKCDCGLNFVLMKPAGGRASDYLVLPNGEQISPYLLTTSIEHVDGLLKYQIVQTDKNSIVVNLVLDERYNGSDFQNEQTMAQILDILTNATSDSFHIKIKKCRTIKIEENGKCKVVKNQYLNKN